jgi:DNA-binding transcriptional LysR family regulator
MELRHLRYFVAVAEELNFRRAAERLHVAQPPLSRQIRDLEAEIGERLFHRDRRHVVLTEAGRELLGEARGLLAGATAAMQAARDAGRGTRGTLRLGTIGALSASFLPRSLAAFREQFQRVDIEILELQMDEQCTALLAGTIQLGFQVRIPGMPVDPRFSARAVIDCGVSVMIAFHQAGTGSPGRCDHRGSGSF